MQNNISPIPENIADIRVNIEKAAKRSGRRPADINLIAVTKTVGVEAIMTALDCGIKTIGESRIQEALKKHQVIGNRVDWHFIGPLQKNKAKFVPGIFSMVHSVDSFELAAELDRRSGILGKSVSILLEINIGEEKTKNGLMPSDVQKVVAKVATLKNLKLEGLMAIPPPPVESPEESRKYFRKVVELKKELELLKLENCGFDILSFGMTDDYEVAVEEGATHLRIGRGVFGERKHKA
jgi:pyridoxal phosphate enzyme (YggS family)